MVKNEIEVNSLEEDLTLATAEMRLAFKEINKNENEIKQLTELAQFLYKRSVKS